MLRKSKTMDRGHSDHKETEDSKSPRKKSRTFKSSVRAKDEEEKIFEKLVFGDSAELLTNLGESRRSSNEKTGEIQSEFVGSEVLDAVPKRVPVWEDDEDAHDSVNVNMRHKDLINGSGTSSRKAQFENISGTPKWANLENARAEKSEDTDLLQRTGSYLRSFSALPKGTVSVKKCKNANFESVATSPGRVKSLQFHPSAQVILTAGFDLRVSLYQVDGKNNPRIESIYFERFPIHCARFATNGEEFIVGSNFAYFYYYNMMVGKIVRVKYIKATEENVMRRFVVSPDGKFIVFYGTYGRMHLLSAKTKELIKTIKMNGHVGSMCFSRSGDTLYSFGDEGKVYIWDMNSLACIHKFDDEGCLRGMAVACSPNDQFIACGSNSGVVNIYDQADCVSSSLPKPRKVLLNMTTPITDLKFNCTSELMTVISSEKEKAVKMVHFPSMSVFSNFPDMKDQALRIPLCQDISLNSGYYAVGTHKGDALLYRLQHYDNY